MIRNLEPVVEGKAQRLWWFDMWRRLGRQIHRAAAAGERSEYAFIVPDRRYVAMALAVGSLDEASPVLELDEAGLEQLVGSGVRAILIKGQYLAEETVQLVGHDAGGWRLQQPALTIVEPCAAAIRAAGTDPHSSRIMRKSHWGMLVEWCGGDRATALAWLRAGRPRIAIHGTKSHLHDEAGDVELGAGAHGIPVSDLAITERWVVDGAESWLRIDSADCPPTAARDVVILDGTRTSRIHPYLDNAAVIRILDRHDAEVMAETRELATRRMMRSEAAWRPGIWDLPPGVEFMGWAS